MYKINMILIELQPIAPERQALRLRITADCARQRVARATQTRRYGFHFGKKIGRNRRYFCCKLPPIAPDGRTDGHFFDFDNYI